MDFTPGSVQVNYDKTMSDGLPGGMADANPTVKNTFIAEGGDIPYGVVISRGSVADVRGGSQTGRIGATGSLAATKGYAIGTGIVDQTIATWAAIDDGEFTISINGLEKVVDAVDFSTADDFTSVAAILQAAIRAEAAGGFTLATVTYDYTARQFTITSGTTGVLSSVSDVTPKAEGTGTDISAMMGMDTAFNVQGAASIGLSVLGVTCRVLTHESASIANSGVATVKEGQTGVVQVDGKIKVLAQESAVDGASVYFVDATGLIYFSSGSGRTQLGSAKLRGAAETGKVAIIDIIGVR